MFVEVIPLGIASFLIKYFRGLLYNTTNGLFLQVRCRE